MSTKIYPTSDTSLTCLVCHATNNFTSSGCSESLLHFAYTITLYNYGTSYVGESARLSSAAFIPRLLSSITVVPRLRLTSSAVTSRLLRMQSPSDISVAVATQWTFCYNRVYFQGNGLRRFHRSVSSGFQHVTIYLL
jgi:hypothetical protein